ncbi:20694_t:CDS:2 [Rhizophagus irregularis]|nr:20694_t:CDS:2 [Rhizophagus irregularis]
MNFLEFAKEYKKLFPNITSEEICKAFQVNNEHQELKRKRVVDVVDVSARTLENFKKRPKPTLPPVNELVGFLERPLSEDLKIPLLQYQYDCLISNNFEDLCTSKDLNILFCVSKFENSFGFYSKFVSASLWNNPPSNVGTEYSFVSFWDNNIRYPLELLLPDGNFVRNTSKHMSTNRDRPDYGFLLSNACLFRGEEKSFLNEDPRAELGNKLVWTYEPAPYILGYYANGPTVEFVAICSPQPGSTEPNIFNIAKSDLQTKAQRILHLRRMINLSLIIESIHNAIGLHDFPEFYPVKRSDKIIEVCATKVKKTFTHSYPAINYGRVEKLRNIYKKLEVKGVPNVDKLFASYCDEKHGAVVYLEPKGIRVNPSNQEELLNAIICILETLEVLHSEDDPIFHQDIRWSHVVRLSNEKSKWILIDWDDSDSPPTRPASHLAKDNHTPEVFEAGHGGEVDIWGVGRLITDASIWITGLSHNIIKFGEQMQTSHHSPRNWKDPENFNPAWLGFGSVSLPTDSIHKDKLRIGSDGSGTMEIFPVSLIFKRRKN